MDEGKEEDHGEKRNFNSAAADGAVVGSSIVKIIENNLNNKKQMMNEIGFFIEELKKGTKE